MSRQASRKDGLNHPLWSVPTSVVDLPETGTQVELVADDATREAVAKAMDLLAVPRLRASFELHRRGSDSVRVTGRVLATVGQTCVVTLEPLENIVDEPVDLLFSSPELIPQQPPGADSDGEVADLPEPLHNGTIDLGAVAVESLLLGIDPYPRKPGAVFEPPAEAKDPALHPFAALAALKRGSGDAPDN